MSNSVWPHRWQPTRLRHPWDSPSKNTGVGCHFLLQCMKLKSESQVAQLCPTLHDPMDCSPPGSSVHGSFQARVLEWGAIAFYLFSIQIIFKLSQFKSVPQFSSVQFSCSVTSDSLQPHESQHARPPCPLPTPRVHSNSGPSSWWCHPTISSSVIPFTSCPQSLPASESFPMSQLFTWGGQSIGVFALASFLPKNTQDWSPLEWTGWLSLKSKGLSTVFSSTTIQKHHFFGTQLSSQSNFHIHTWLLEKT